MASPPPAQRQRDVGCRRNAPRMSAPEPSAPARAAAATAEPRNLWRAARVLGLWAERDELSAMHAPGLGRPSVSCSYSTRRLGVWGATFRFPAVDFPKLDHGCMAAGPASAAGDWSPFPPPRSPGAPHSTSPGSRIPPPECASIRRRVVVMAALSEAFLSLDTTTPSPPRSRPSHPSGL